MCVVFVVVVAVVAVVAVVVVVVAVVVVVIIVVVVVVVVAERRFGVGGCRQESKDAISVDVRSPMEKRRRLRGIASSCDATTTMTTTTQARVIASDSSLPLGRLRTLASVKTNESLRK